MGMGLPSYDQVRQTLLDHPDDIDEVVVPKMEFFSTV